MKAKVLTAALLGLGLTSLAHAQDSMPKVAQPFQTSMQAVWKQVTKAELPVYECTQVVGTASRMVADGKNINDARQAFRACYVDSAVRFSEAYFKKLHHAELAENGKPYGCDMYSRYLKGHVGSMETQVERFDLKADELNQEILSRINSTAQSCETSLP